MHLKTVRVTNNKNVLVQLPGLMIKKWGIEEGDCIDVHVSEDEQTIIIKPRKGPIKISAGRRPEEGDNGILRYAT